MGLVAAQEASEELIDKGWFQLTMIEGTLDPSDGIEKPCYCFKQWNPFKRKYVTPGEPDPQMIELCRQWAKL